MSSEAPVEPVEAVALATRPKRLDDGTVVSPASGGRTSRARFGSILALAVGHATVDFYPGSLASILPYLITKLGLSLTAAGSLATLQSFATSLVQPVFGYVIDSGRPRPWGAWAVAAAAVFFSLLGLAPNALVLATLIVLGGLGVALYHPQGASMATRLGGRRSGLAMSLFGTGGSIGHSLGPLVAVFLVESRGLESLVVLALPGLLVAVFIHRALQVPLVELDNGGQRLAIRASLTGYWRHILLLLAIVMVRSGVAMGVGTMLPIYLEAKGLSLVIGGTAIFVFRIAGSVGMFFGGALSDQLGRKRVMIASFAMALPFTYLFFNSDGLMRMVHLALASAVLTSSTPVNTVIAQEVMPKAAAVACGLMIGLGWALGSISVTFIGFFADLYGIEAVLPLATVGLVVAGLFLTLWLPREKETQASAA